MLFSYNLRGKGTTYKYSIKLSEGKFVKTLIFTKA